MAEDPQKTSRIPGFYKLDVGQLLREVQRFADLTDDEVEVAVGVPVRDARRRCAADLDRLTVGALDRVGQAEATLHQAWEEVELAGP